MEELNSKLEEGRAQALTQASQEKHKATLMEQKLNELERKHADLEKIRGSID